MFAIRAYHYIYDLSLFDINKVGKKKLKYNHIKTFSHYTMVLVIALDQSDKDDENISLQLQNMVNEFNVFADIDECIDYITDFDDTKIILIIKETIGHEILSLIHNISQIDSIYIFCNKKSNENQWTKSEKVKGIYTEMTSMCESLQQIMKRFDQNSIPMSFIAADQEYFLQNLNELEPSFMYTQLFKETLLEMKYSEQSIKNFTVYCRNGNHGSSTNITRFENEYNPQSAIWWYTFPSFIYLLLNTALRLLQTDTIIEMGFFMHDLHQQITQLHQKQIIGSEKKIFDVFRGQGFSKSDFEKLQKTKGGLISFNNFLSTSRARDVSLEYADCASTQDNMIGVLLHMFIDPSISRAPFADIQDVSYFHNEEEVLFSMHTIFRIGEIEQVNGNDSLYEVNLQLTSDDDQQLRTLTEYLRKEMIGCEKWTQLGVLLYKTGHFNKAERLFNTLLEQTSDETERIAHCNALGCLKVELGNYEQAICYFEKGLQFVEKTSSPDKLPVISLYNNLGGVYTSMKQSSKALSFYEKGLTIAEKFFHSNHPNLAFFYNNIGEVYKNIGEYSKAFSYYKKSLEIREKCLPLNHPDLTVSYNNIAMIYQKMAEYPKALFYLKKSLENKRRTLPEDHPDFANVYRNIGIVYNHMGEFNKAISFYKQAMEIEEKLFDSNHPNLALSYNNIGEAYQNNGDFTQALSFYQKSLEIKEKILSPTDSDLATTYNNISTLYSDLEQYSEAILYFTKAIDIREKILSPNHLDFGQSYNNIAAVFYKMGEYQNALSFYEKALQIVKINLSPYHPLCATCYDNMGSVYNSMMEYTKALSFYKQALTIRQNILSPYHPDLAQCFNNMATVYAEMNDYSNAMMFYERALHILQRSLPPGHPNIFITQENIRTLKKRM